jgi:hypothetical protein
MLSRLWRVAVGLAPAKKLKSGPTPFFTREADYQSQNVFPEILARAPVFSKTKRGGPRTWASGLIRRVRCVVFLSAPTLASGKVMAVEASGSVDLFRLGPLSCSPHPLFDGRTDTPEGPSHGSARNEVLRSPGFGAKDRRPPAVCQQGLWHAILAAFLFASPALNAAEVMANSIGESQKKKPNFDGCG